MFASHRCEGRVDFLDAGAGIDCGCAVAVLERLPSKSFGYRVAEIPLYPLQGGRTVVEATWHCLRNQPRPRFGRVTDGRFVRSDEGEAGARLCSKRSRRPVLRWATAAGAVGYRRRNRIEGDPGPAPLSIAEVIGRCATCPCCVLFIDSTLRRVPPAPSFRRPAMLRIGLWQMDFERGSRRVAARQSATADLR